MGVKQVFNEFDADNSGTIEYTELVVAMTKLHVTSEEQIKELFNEADFYENGKLTFKEFIITIALGFILELIPNEDNQEFQNLNLKGAFELILDAWLIFDQNASGSIDKTEMMGTLSTADVSEEAMLKKKTKGASNKNAFLTAERWDEADWDKNGSITFKEFLFAFCSWINLDDE